jgi:protein-disulfide isomerase
MPTNDTPSRDPRTTTRTTKAATTGPARGTTARRQAAREEAARLRREQESRARRARILAIGGLGVAVVVLAVVVTLVLRNASATREAYDDVVYGGAAQGVVAPALADVTAPAPADDSGGVPVSADGVGSTGDAPVQVTVYLDFMCPFCGRFESVNGPMLAERVAAGDIAVTYHTLSILDRQSAGSAYSTRAANAAAVVADRAPEHYPDFVTALFADQPAEGTIGLTDAEIADRAREVGVPQDVTDEFTATTDGTSATADGDEADGTWRTYAPWVAALTQQAGTDLGELRTPTILIDGQPFTGDPTAPGALEAAIDAAVG